MMDKGTIDRLLRDNYRGFESSEFYFSEDSRMNEESLWDRSKLRVMFVYLSCGRYRSNSNTFNTMYSIVKNTDRDIFVDYCYYPYQDDKDTLDGMGIPYIFGNVSHRCACDYDVVFINCSVLKEVFNLPYMLNKSGIPLSSDERFKRDDMPLLVMGGSSASVCHILFGKVNEKGNSLVDMALFGKGERTLPALLKSLVMWKKVNKSCTSSKHMVVRQLFRDKILRECLYYPNAYEYSYDGFSLKHFKEKKEFEGIVPYKPKVERDVDLFISFSNKILNLDGSFNNYGDLLVSSGCTKCGSCSFCLEGSVGGSWKDKSLDVLEEEIRELKFNTGCEALGIFSFNSNYYGGIGNLVGIGSEYFERVSLLASRADVYADNLEFLSMCKKLGAIKIGIAAEGLSDDIRNRVLNKGLSKDKLRKAVFNIMRSGFLTIKINYILTGKETREDFDEWINDLGEYVRIKKEGGFKTRLSLTITNLVVYDQTALRYEERKTAKESLNYKESEFIKIFLDYMSKVKKLGIMISLYGVFYVNAVEQLILDLGSSSTEMLVKASLDLGVYYDKEITKRMCEDFITLVETTYKTSDIFKGRSVDYLFYSDILEFNHPAVIERYKKAYEADNYRTITCNNRIKGNGDCIDNCAFYADIKDGMQGRGDKIINTSSDKIPANTDTISANTATPEQNETIDRDDNIDSITEQENTTDTDRIDNEVDTETTDTIDERDTNRTEIDDKRTIEATDDVGEQRTEELENDYEIKKSRSERRYVLRIILNRIERYSYVSPETQLVLLSGSIMRMVDRIKYELITLLAEYEDFVQNNAINELLVESYPNKNSFIEIMRSMYKRDGIERKLLNKVENTLKSAGLVKVALNCDKMGSDSAIDDLMYWVDYLDNIDPAKIFVKANKNSLSYVSGNYLKPYYSGSYAVDYILRYDLRELIPYINACLKNVGLTSANIVRAFMVDNDDESLLSINNFNIFVGIVDNSFVKNDKTIRIDELMPKFRDRFIINGDYSVLCRDVRKSISLMLKNTQINPTDIKMFTKDLPLKNKTIVGFIVKSNISPYLIIKTLYPKIKLTDIYSHSRFSLVNSFRSNDYGIKCSCGNSIGFDIFKNDMGNKCPNCIAKIYVNNLYNSLR